MTYTKMAMLMGVVVAMGLVGGIGWGATHREGKDRPAVTTTDAAQPDVPPNQQPAKADVGAARAGQQAPKDEFNELLDVVKLDPVVVAAMKADPADSPLKKLQKELCREQADFLRKVRSQQEIGKFNPEDYHQVFTLFASLMENLLPLLDRPADKLKCLELRVKAYRQWEQFTEVRVKLGADPSQQLNLAAAERIKAEIEVLKFKEAMAKAKK